MLDSFIKAFFQLLDLILTVYIWLIIARAIISWVNPSPYHPVVRFLYRVTEPVLSPLRKVIPPLAGLDITPLIIIFFIYFLQNLLRKLMVQYFL
ncbi:MAG: YggT family protein [Thermodesulfobacteriaceae bacterium]|nr:YggT family protein [Thermodesulfobacteriaceae bacterium]MCX8042038.1 YggT family protein [Thermodesulfobacteriaceae bacterium]MDW8136139.1 YggT family protein [Thermodesulfobacterium sp.]